MEGMVVYNDNVALGLDEGVYIWEVLGREGYHG